MFTASNHPKCIQLLETFKSNNQNVRVEATATATATRSLDIDSGLAACAAYASYSKQVEHSN